MTTYKFNVWTNIAYVIAGLYGLYFGVNPVASIAVVFLGIGSFHGHYTKDFWIDWIAMWVAFSAVISSFLFKDPLIQVFFTVAVAALLRQLELWLRDVKFELLGLQDHYLLLGVVYFTGFILSFWHLSIMDSLAYGALFLIAFIIRQKKPFKKQIYRLEYFHDDDGWEWIPVPIRVVDYSHGVWHIITAIGYAVIL